MEAELIAESVSPNGNMEALVEQDDHVAYFYVRQPEHDMRACWVRNLHEAPAELDVAVMKDGRPPMLPRAACRNPLGRLPLQRDALTIVWLEEGDGAALVEDGDILAVVPTWDTATGFEGYARDCILKSPVAWPMPEGDVLRQRVQRAAAWWASWDDGDPWTPYRDTAVAALTSTFGEPTNYYASGQDEWPPLAVVRFRRDDVVYLLTGGMGLRPQPRVELAYADPAPYRRVELAMAMDPALVDADKGAIITWLGSQGRFPWHFRTFLGSGHTMPCDGLPTSAVAAPFNAVLWLRDPAGVPAVQYPDFRGDPVSVLWALPITAAERDLAEKSGSAALVSALTDAGHTATFRQRDGIVPDQTSAAGGRPPA